MVKLSESELKDLTMTACERVLRDLARTIQLVDDPGQRANVAFMATLGLFALRNYLTTGQPRWREAFELA